MNTQMKQSLEFDLKNLNEELKKIESEIKEKREKLAFISGKVKAVGTAGGGISGGLTKILMRGPMPIKLGALAVVEGAEIGYDLADKAVRKMEVNIGLLENKRNNILKKIETVRQRIGEIGPDK